MRERERWSCAQNIKFSVYSTHNDKRSVSVCASVIVGRIDAAAAAACVVSRFQFQNHHHAFGYSIHAHSQQRANNTKYPEMVLFERNSQAKLELRLWYRPSNVTAAPIKMARENVRLFSVAIVRYVRFVRTCVWVCVCSSVHFISFRIEHKIQDGNGNAKSMWQQQQCNPSDCIRMSFNDSHDSHNQCLPLARARHIYLSVCVCVLLETRLCRLIRLVRGGRICFVCERRANAHMKIDVKPLKSSQRKSGSGWQPEKAWHSRQSISVTPTNTIFRDRLWAPEQADSYVFFGKYNISLFLVSVSHMGRFVWPTHNGHGNFVVGRGRTAMVKMGFIAH